MFVQDTGVKVFAGQPGMASTDFFNPKKFDILKIGAVSQYLAQKVVGLTPAQGAAPCIMCCLMDPEDLIGEQFHLLLLAMPYVFWMSTWPKAGALLITTQCLIYPAYHELESINSSGITIVLITLLLL